MIVNVLNAKIFTSKNKKIISAEMWNVLAEKYVCACKMSFASYYIVSVIIN